eukprot:jgi/Chlat1/8102/Chrsp75S00604
MATTMGFYEELITPVKKELFQHIDPSCQELLEVGMGTAPNLKFYAEMLSPEVHLIGVDPNPAMSSYAMKAARKAGLSNIALLSGVAERLPLSDRSVDTVIATLLLCSVPDVTTALKEIQRVLRPGGSYFFIEHVAAPKSTWKRLAQDVLNPLQNVAADGCNLNRDTLSAINAAGFSRVDARQLNLDGAGILSPHIAGEARV